MKIDLLVVNAEIYTPIDKGRPLAGEDAGALLHIANGAVAVKDGTIVDVGETGRLKGQYAEAVRVVDAAGRALIPGFVDPHTHALFIGSREDEFVMRMKGKSYMEILREGGGILNTLKRIRKATLEELAEALKRRLSVFLEYGTTAVEIKSGYGLDTVNELKMLKAIKSVSQSTDMELVATFIGAHAVPPEYANRKGDYVDLVVNEMIPAVAELGLAEFVDVFCEQGVFDVRETRRILKAACEVGLKAKIHADEIKAIGCSELSGEIKIVSCDHLLKIQPSGIAAMRSSGTIATLLPITAFSLREPYAPARELIDGCVPVALATDCNPGSSYSESMPMAITLAVVEMGMTPDEALVSSTLNAAYALDKAARIGSIEPGKRANFVILKEDSHLFIPYHVGINPVYETYVGGWCAFTAAD